MHDKRAFNFTLDIHLHYHITKPIGKLMYECPAMTSISINKDVDVRFTGYKKLDLSSLCNFLVFMMAFFLNLTGALYLFH